MRAIAAERRRNRVFHRSGRAEAPVRELLDGSQDVVQAVRASDRHPPGTPSRRKVRLRQRREGNDRRVGIEACHRRDRAGVGEIAVDLVGEQRNVVRVGELDERAACLGRIGRTGWIVGIDDDERARGGRDQAADVIEIGLPPVRRVRPVEDRARANLRENSRVQRVGRRGHEHFVPAFRERGQGQLDALGGAGSDDDAIGRDRHAASGQLGGNRLARGKDAHRRGVAVAAVAHRAVHRFDQMRRRFEPERNRVADVQIPHLSAGRLNLAGLGDDIADGVNESADAGGDANTGGRWHREILADAFPCKNEVRKIGGCVGFARSVPFLRLNNSEIWP